MRLNINLLFIGCLLNLNTQCDGFSIFHNIIPNIRNPHIDFKDVSPHSVEIKLSQWLRKIRYQNQETHLDASNMISIKNVKDDLVSDLQKHYIMWEPKTNRKFSMANMENIDSIMIISFHYDYYDIDSMRIVVDNIIHNPNVHDLNLPYDEFQKSLEQYFKQEYDASDVKYNNLSYLFTSSIKN